MLKINMYKMRTTNVVAIVLRRGGTVKMETSWGPSTLCYTYIMCMGQARPIYYMGSLISVWYKLRRNCDVVLCYRNYVVDHWNWPINWVFWLHIKSSSSTLMIETPTFFFSFSFSLFLKVRERYSLTSTEEPCV